MRNYLIIAGIALALSGCATTTLYDWGNYEDDLFDYYHQPGQKDAVMADLIEHLQMQETKGRKPAPGLLAEAGTFYLLDGNKEMAVTYYKKEAATWPESTEMMSSLISNLEEQ